VSLTNNESQLTRLQQFISFVHVIYYASIHIPHTTQYTDKWIWQLSSE